jgi:hypothetical protein
MAIMIAKTSPDKTMADFTPLSTFISAVSGTDKKRRQWLSKPDSDVDAEYDRIKKAGLVQCSDDKSASKQEKVDRILTTSEFPGSGLEFRPVKVSPADMNVMESDWDYSNAGNVETARMLCLDPRTNALSASKTRAKGEEGSVAPPRGACKADFPGSIEIGSVHTHPPYFDKPLESLGDVLAFGAGEEMFSCTTTKWGINCLHRNREPALVFNIPKVNKKSKNYVYDKDGRLVYDVKSDVVDWMKSVDYSRRGLMDSVFLASLGDASDKIIQAMVTIPWFKPMGVSRPSIASASAPFTFGTEKSAMRGTGNLYCESFVDIVGESTKLRTVCNDFVKRDGSGSVKSEPGFYVESEIKARALPWYAPGFPTNVYVDEKIAGDVERIKLKRENSKFWDYSDPARPGYHETSSERKARAIGVKMKRDVENAGAILIKRGKDERGRKLVDKECEYLLLPLPEGNNKIVGKPAGLYCHEKSRPVTEETCILVATR